MLILLTLLAVCVSDPLPVKDCASLQSINNNLAGDYVLEADVDCHGAEFTPIGSPSTPFTGKFDGSFKRVLGISVTFELRKNYVGLFGYISKASVKNVQITARIQANSFAAVLVGYANSSFIESVSVIGNVLGGAYIGGMAGTLIQCTVVNCSSSATVVSNGGGLGGLAAGVTSSTISRCNVSGFVTASNCMYVGSLIGQINGTSGARSFLTESSSYAVVVGSTCTGAGGLVGIADTWTTIQNSFSVSDVQGGVGTGGLIGAANGAFIVFSYAVGNVTSSSTAYVGGLAGCSGGAAPSITNSYFDSSMIADRCAQPGRSNLEMKQRVTFANWDFVMTWGIHEGVSNPFFLPH